jgi:protein-disulfide isomerase
MERNEWFPMRALVFAGFVLLVSCLAWAAPPGSQSAGAGPGDEQLQAVVRAYVARTMAMQPLDDVKIELGSPDGSGLRKVVVRLGGSLREVVETLYITADGKEVLRGTLEKLSADPWSESRLKLRPAVGASPSIGGEDAVVTIVEFGDFQCPYCQEMNADLERLLQAFSGRLRWVFVALPLKVHDWSQDAAAAGDCVAAQGSSRFWSFEHSVYAQQMAIRQETARTQLRELAVQAGVEASIYDRCLSSPETGRRIAASTRLAQELAVASTPTLFVNGRKLAGAVSFDALKAAVENELALSSGKTSLAGTK